MAPFSFSMTEYRRLEFETYRMLLSVNPGVVDNARFSPVTPLSAYRVVPNTSQKGAQNLLDMVWLMCTYRCVLLRLAVPCGRFGQYESISVGVVKVLRG